MYPRPDSFVGKEVDGHRIEAVLGRGGMGIVFRAVNLELSRTVALKIINPVLAQDESFLRRFRSEARALGKIHHPNIVLVYAFRPFNMGFYISMEYVDGMTLAERLEEYSVIPWEKGVGLMKQMLSALEYAHDAGVIHRDIKPRNIMLAPYDVVKITDFGLAKVVQEGKVEGDTTLTNATGGTIHYMSPEQIRGLGNVDARGDLFSLALTCYESFTGQLPFDKAASGYTIQKTIVEEPFTHPQKVNPEIPRSLSNIIMKALEKDPEKRFQSAADMRDALESFEKGNSFVSQPRITYNKSPLPGSTLTRYRPYVLAAAVCLIMIVGIAIFQRGKDDTDGSGSVAIIDANASSAVPNSGSTDVELGSSPPSLPVDEDSSAIQTDPDSLIEEPVNPVTIVPDTASADTSAVFDPLPDFILTTGSLNLTSVPAGASVYMDEEIVGITPMTLNEVTTGSRLLRFELEGFASYTTNLDLETDQVLPVEAVLEPEEAMLTFTGTPGSEIKIDGRTFDYEGDPLYIPLSAANYTLEVSHPDHRTWRSPIAFVYGDNKELNIDLTERVQISVTAFDLQENALQFGEIYLNDEFTGKYTPAPIIVPVGLNKIEVRLDGYSPTNPNQQINITPDRSDSPVRILLSPDS